MYDIKMGEISWTNRQVLMQRRINHTHAAALVPHPTSVVGSKQGLMVERKLACKFHKAGTCRETTDSHTNPMTGLLYFHDGATRKK